MPSERDATLEIRKSYFTKSLVCFKILIVTFKLISLDCPPPFLCLFYWSDLNSVLFQWEVMPDLFFYRDPEEAEKEEKER